MIAFLGVASFFMFIVFIIKFIIALKKRQRKMPLAIGAIIAIIICTVCVYVSGDEKLVSEKPNLIEVEEKKTSEQDLVFDKLQLLYMAIDSDMDFDEVFSSIKASGLPYSLIENNDYITFRIALEENVAKGYRPEDGSNIEISFGCSDWSTEYSFFNAIYFNQEKSIDIINKTKGDYFSLSESDNGLYTMTYFVSEEEKFKKFETKEEQFIFLNNFERVNRE